jgi:hypothetical protein
MIFFLSGGWLLLPGGPGFGWRSLLRGDGLCLWGGDDFFGVAKVGFQAGGMFLADIRLGK